MSKNKDESNGRYVYLSEEEEELIYNYAAQGMSDYLIRNQIMHFHGFEISRTKIHNIIKKKDEERKLNGLCRLQEMGLI